MRVLFYLSKAKNMTNTEIAETKSTELMLSQEMTTLLAEHAEGSASNEKASTPFISIRGKKFTLEDTKLGTSMQCVVLATAYDNSFYDRPYDPDTITPPACFSLSVSGDDMVPHPSSPVPQNDTCKGCPQNEYGTALQGKGKACKNNRRLLLAAADTKDNYVGLDELAIVKLPPTSLKSWASYAKGIPARLSRTVWSVVTQLAMDEDEDYPKIVPSFVAPINDGEIIQEIISNKTFYEDTVLNPYDVSSYTPPAAPSSDGPKKSKMS
jgi:hypothetical protein